MINIISKKINEMDVDEIRELLEILKEHDDDIINIIEESIKEMQET